MDGMVEVRDYFYRNQDGTVRRERWIGGRCIEKNANYPVVFVDWSHIEAAWITLVKVPRSLVKEGPKAIVKYER